jgi:HEPN domain-containing protein
MRPPEEALREIVHEWMAKAELDCRAAERLAHDEDPMRPIIAFHCQQAAEKYLKALLVRHRIEFPKTHNIGELLDLLIPVAGDVARLLPDANRLTPYGVEIRYPSDFPDVLPGEEAALLALAQSVRQAVLACLESYLNP